MKTSSILHALPPNAPAILVLVLMHSVLLADVVLHDPHVAYDAHEHLAYIDVLSKLRLPDAKDSGEFFSPPLPYVFPALVRMTGIAEVGGAAKFGQLLNLCFSLGVCVYVLKICGLILPGCYALRFWSLALLAIVPAYYKSFSMVRGEPLLCLLVVAAAYWTLRAYGTRPRRMRDFVCLGLLFGMAILARQWAFFVLPAIAAFAVLLPTTDRRGRFLNLLPLVLSFLIAAAVGGWFYVGLRVRYGRMTAFNRPHAALWWLSDESRKSRIGLGLDELFKDPIRPSFANELIPIFYSELWGDYQCYFLVYGKDRRDGRFYAGDDLELALSQSQGMTWLETNRFRIARYIGMAQAVDLVPSALYLMGLVLGAASVVRKHRPNSAMALITLITLVSLLGYFCFLVLYPSPGKGDTAKATYLLQVLPFVAILAARLLVSIRERSRWAHHVIVGLLTVSAALNVPLLFTRYIGWP